MFARVMIKSIKNSDKKALILPNISLRLSYRSGRDDTLRDFFIPCLEKSELYRRSAGYFTSAGLALAARGVASLASRLGKMRLVVSPYLEPEDLKALQAASDNPAKALKSIAAKSLQDIEDALIKERLNALGWFQAGRDLLERYRIPDRPPAGLAIEKLRAPSPKNEFRPPRGFELRPYQAEAIRAWIKAGGKGIFAMATGSGKTFTDGISMKLRLSATLECRLPYIYS